MNCGDSSFINEIKDYSAEEIRLILSDQKDLYTPDEIEQLRRAEHRHMQASGQTARKLRWHANRNGHMPPHDSPEGDKPA